MSIDPKNTGLLTGGVVADPELVGDRKNVLKLRVAVDWAGNDSKDPSNKSGYFNVTYFLNSEDSNAKFIASQVEQQKLKKGSQIQVVYRLVQDRWERDGKSGQGVTLIAEAITYAGGGAPSKAGEESEGGQSAPPVSEF